jgi:hypothetical protein
VTAIGWICTVFSGLACATLPPPTGGSIDFVQRPDDRVAQSLAIYEGSVVLLDVCTSWVAACNVNAKVLDEVLVAFPEQPVVAVTLLLDDPQMAAPALAAYRDDFHVQHPVVLAGPRVRAGTSSLRDTGYVPRIVVLDKQGRVRIDEAGGVIGLEGLVERVRPLVSEPSAP